MLKTNFMDGFLYMFRGENVVNLVVLPGGVCLLSTLLMIIPIMLMAVLLPGGIKGGNDLTGGLMPIVAGLFMVLFLVLFLVVVLWMYGYFWRIVGQWVREGFDSPAPSWLMDIPGTLFDGFKLLLYSMTMGLVYGFVMCVVMLPAVMSGAFSRGAGNPESMSPETLILLLIGMGLFLVLNLVSAPLWVAPIFYAAPQRRLSKLFDLFGAFAWALPNYWQALLVMVINFIVQMVLMVVQMVVHYATCGVGSLLSPFLTVPTALLLYYWLAEVYWKAPPKELETAP